MDTKERPKKELTTPSGYNVVIKTYATAREFENIQQCYMEGAQMSLVGKTPKIDNFNPKSDFEAQKKTLEMLVVSVNGEEERGKVLAMFLDEMPKPDYDFVMAELDELSGKKKAVESLEQ